MGKSFLSDTIILLGKRETTAGTAETLSSTDFDVRVRNVELSDLSIEYDDDSSKYANGNHTRDEAVPGVQRTGQSFSVKITPPAMSGAPNTYTVNYPVIKYYEAAGLSASFDVSAGTYTLVPQLAADVQTITNAIYYKDSESLDLIKVEGAGMMAELEIIADGVSKPFMANFSLRGKVSEVVEVPSSATPVLNEATLVTTSPLINNNTVIKITKVGNDGISASPLYEHQFCSNSLSLKMGTTINSIECQEDNSGLLYDSIVSRAPELTIDPLMEKLSDFDFWGNMTSSQKFKIEITKYNDVAKTEKGMEIIVPIAQLMSPGVSESNGYMRNSLTFRALRNLQGATAAQKENDFTIILYGEDLD